MASDLHKVVEKAREAAAVEETSSLGGVIYRGTGYPYAKTISVGVLKQRLLAGTLKDIFPEHCSGDLGVCYRSTVENTSSVVASGLVSALLMSSVRDHALAGTWKESIYVGKKGISEEQVREAAANGEHPTIVCYLTVRR